MSSNNGGSNDVIRWGIVGLGDVTEKKSGPPFWKCNGSVLAAVLRRTPGKAVEWSKRVKNTDGSECVGYDDIDKFLQHKGLDAIYIATRPGTHADLVEKVAAAGTTIRAVYVEKPVGRCAEETQAMADAMTKTRGQDSFYTAYISRAYPRTEGVRQLLRDGAIGDRVTSVSYNLVGMGGARDVAGRDDGNIPWRFDASQSGGGLVMDVGCHLIDRIDYLCGPLICVDGTAEQRGSPTVLNVEDFVHFDAVIGSSDWAVIPSEGAKVSCTWDFSGTTNEVDSDVLEIVGPKGSLRMAAMSASLPISVYDTNGTLQRELDFDMPEHTAQAMIQAITDKMRGESLQASCLSTANNAMRTSRVLDQVLKSYYGSRDPGYWKEPVLWPGRKANS